MEVTLTVESADGGLGYVSAVGADYTDAYGKALALVPADCKPIVIRTSLNNETAPPSQRRMGLFCVTEHNRIYPTGRLIRYGDHFRAS